MSGRLAGRLRAVVTGIAGAGGQVMAEGCRYPGITVVTAVTFEAGLNVFKVFTRRNRVVVAAAASTDHFTMIGGEGRSPSGVGVTGFARIGGLDMRRILTGSDGPIVTTETGTQHLIVIGGQGRCPFGVGMTGFTRIG